MASIDNPKRAQTTALSDVDVNRQLDSPNKISKDMIDQGTDKAMNKPELVFGEESKQHRSLHSRLLTQERTGKQTGTYVSPSDNILSPASAKLSAFKQRRLQKPVKPRNLFAMRPDSSHSEK